MNDKTTTATLVEHLRFRAESAGYPKRDLYDAAADKIEHWMARALKAEGMGPARQEPPADVERRAVNAESVEHWGGHD